VAAQGVKDIKDFMKEKSGIYHLTSSSKTSWFGFCQVIVANSGHIIDKNSKLHLKAVSLEGYEMLTAKRSKNCLLDNSKIREKFRIVMPKWNDQLDLVLDDIISKNSI
jgi:dTDP-4-dehydrorhamnose reductase